MLTIITSAKLYAKFINQVFVEYPRNKSEKFFCEGAIKKIFSAERLRDLNLTNAQIFRFVKMLLNLLSSSDLI